MLFNSHIFMLLFLPLLLAGWYFLNWKKKFQLAQGYLIGMSLWFYAYANLQYLWLLLFSCLIGWLLSCLPEKISSEKGKKVLTGVGCVFHLGLLGYFKYSNFFLENLNTVFHTDFPMLQILLPVGISFYTFQQLAYLIDRCRGDAPRDSFFDYLTFMVYFPQLLQGPILLRSEFMGQLKEPERRRFHAERFSEGIQFFVFGLAKKVLLADTLAKAVNYGYIPLGGNRRGKMRTLCNVMIVMLLSGLWHGAAWTFVLWGFLHGVGMIWDNLEHPHLPKKWMRQAATFAYVCMTFVFFRAESIAQGVDVLKSIVSLKWNGFVFQMASALDMTECYIITKTLSMKLPGLLSWFWLGIFVVLIAICFRVLSGEKVSGVVALQRQKGYGRLYPVLLAVLFTWSMISMTGVSEYLYFSF